MNISQNWGKKHIEGLSFYYLRGKLQIEDPSEDNDHYQTFNTFLWNAISKRTNLEILDIGNTKYGNIALSLLKNNVDALVLRAPNLMQNQVNWIVGDLNSFKTEKKYDVISAPSTLHLVGFGRYGEEVNKTLPLKVGERISKFLKPKGDLIIMLPLGPNTFHQGMHYVFDFETILKIFNKFTLEEFFVDEHAVFRMVSNSGNVKFSKNVETEKMKPGSYKIIYLHFRKK